MRIKDIYSHFNIPQPLQQHMIDVANVAQMICDNWQGETIDQKSIITLALLHDLGNIVKMDFSGHSEYYEQDIEYGQSKKQEILERYGDDCHAVTFAMISELGDFTPLLGMIDAMGSRHFTEPHALEVDILNYADMRVSYDGVVSLEERIEDIYTRYAGKRRRAQEPVRTAYQAYFYPTQEYI